MQMLYMYDKVSIAMLSCYGRIDIQCVELLESCKRVIPR